MSHERGSDVRNETSENRRHFLRRILRLQQLFETLTRDEHVRVHRFHQTLCVMANTMSRSKQFNPHIVLSKQVPNLFPVWQKENTTARPSLPETDKLRLGRTEFRSVENSTITCVGRTRGQVCNSNDHEGVEVSDKMSEFASGDCVLSKIYLQGTAPLL